jgi:hypothetical protein
VTAVYTYLIADLRTNTILGELPLGSVRWSQKLCDSGTLQGQIILTPKLQALNPYQLTTPTSRAIYVLRGNNPVWGGIIWTRKYDSDSKMLTIGASDWWSYFNHRYILPVLSGTAYTDTTYVAGRSTVYTGVDQNQIARNLLAQAALHTGGDIGITVDSNNSGILRDRSYYGYQLKDIGSALADLCNVLNGPDMLFDVGATDSQGRPSRLLRLGAPHLGQQGSPWAWELGGNLRSYVWPSDGTRMETRAYATSDGTAEGTPIGVAEDLTRYTYGWPLLEDAQQYSGVSQSQTLIDHASSDQFVNRLPVVLPTLQVDGSLSPTVDDFSVGDDCRLVIKDEFFTAGLDTSSRIIGLDVSVADEGGEESVQLTLAPLLGDVY